MRPLLTLSDKYSDLLLSRNQSKSFTRCNLSLSRPLTANKRNSTAAPTRLIQSKDNLRSFSKKRSSSRYKSNDFDQDAMKIKVQNLIRNEGNLKELKAKISAILNNTTPLKENHLTEANCYNILSPKIYQPNTNKYKRLLSQTTKSFKTEK